MRRTLLGDVLLGITLTGLVVAIALNLGVPPLREHLAVRIAVAAVGAGLAVWCHAILWAWALANCLTRDWSHDQPAKVRWLLWPLLVQPAAWVYYLRILRPERLRSPGIGQEQR